jgi:hypothetical protein
MLHQRTDFEVKEKKITLLANTKKTKRPTMTKLELKLL